MKPSLMRYLLLSQMLLLIFFMQVGLYLGVLCCQCEHPQAGSCHVSSSQASKSCCSRQAQAATLKLVDWQADPSNTSQDQGPQMQSSCCGSEHLRFEVPPFLALEHEWSEAAASACLCAVCTGQLPLPRYVLPQHFAPAAFALSSPFVAAYRQEALPLPRLSRRLASLQVYRC